MEDHSNNNKQEVADQDSDTEDRTIPTIVLTSEDVPKQEVASIPSSIPPGILNKSSYENNTGDQVYYNDKKGEKDLKKQKSDTQATKVVPPWYLFRFAKPLDVLMILVGMVMAIASGLALPGHMLMFGDIIDLFISFDIAKQLQTNSNMSCFQFQDVFNGMVNVSSNFTLGGDQGEYFCDQSNREDSNIFRYVTSCDVGGSLQDDILLYTFYYLAMAGGLLIAAFFAIALWNWAAYRQSLRMRIAFFKSIMQQDIGWFDVNPSGELNTRLSDDIEKIQSGIGDKAGIFILYFSTFIAGFVIAFVTNWKMSLVVSTMLPLLSILSATIAKIVASFTVREQNAYASAGSVAEETISSVRTVVAFGGEQKEIDRYKRFLTKAKNVGYKKGILTALVTGLLFFVIFSGYALGFWYGATLIADCELNPGKVVTVFFGVVIGSFSLGNALPEIQTFATALGSATAVFAVIDREPLIDATSDEGETIDDLKGNIQFKDVCFTYPARPDVQVLHGLDFEVKVGQTVALVGPSGCGKSTVIQLLQRFYNPSAGQICVDGKNISQLNLKWLRKNIGVVSQEPVLFNTTIRENIKYGRKDINEDDIMIAIKAANAYKFISNLPDGLDTYVGQKGTQLSGGQKQRIAIARALVRDPKILLLDEATSALDTESEKIVQEALDKAREGRTTIVIAHRLSTIQTADVIAGIEDGRVVEMGTHSELMDKEGLYYELVTAQTIETNEESEDVLSQFRVELRRQESRQSQTKRTRLPDSTSSAQGLQRQTSNQSGGGEDVFSALTDHLSHYSIDDLPVMAHPSPALNRKAFSKEPTPVEGEKDETIIVKGGKRTLHVKPSSSSGEKEVHFDSETSQVEVKDSGNRQKWSSKRRKSKEELLGDSDPLVTVTTKELFLLNKPDWYLVITGVIATGILGSLFPMMSILFSGMLELFSSLDRDALLRGVEIYAGYFIVLAVGAATVQFIGISTLSIAGERLTQRLRIQTFSAMLRQEMSWFDRKSHSTGALTSRLAVDASDVKGATGLRLGTVLQTIAGIIAALVIALEASWVLTLVLFCVFPVFMVMGIAQIKLLQGRSNRNKELAAESSKTANEAIDNIRTIAALGLENEFLELYETQLLPPFRSNMKTVLLQAAVFGFAQATIFFVYSGGFSLGAFQVVQDPSSVLYADYEEIFRVYAAVVFTALSIGRASSFAPDAQKAQLSASRIMTLLKRKPQIDGYDKDGLKPDKALGNVSLKNVHFTYPSRPDVPVLQGLSISIHPGETLALVGPSGCGKSTVVSLVERFYDVIAGSVEVDDNDIRDLNIRWLRSQIGIVSQEPVLFDRSIADNIRYGANFREVSDEEVVEVAKAANIDNFIQSLPEGYNTNVGSKGTQLSGGQKQRIAIARALVRDPKILLLDEATSALDTESEKIVQEALDKAREGRTCIVIAHRLSTIYNSDCISVIHNGQVLERGTHSELMAMGGAYYLMNTIQKQENTELEKV